MASVNKVFLIGNLTRDPELRYTPNGAAVTDLGLATNRVYVTKDGDRREEVTFIDVTVWNRQAENCCQYLKKGQPVHIEGYLKLDSWEDRTTGEKRTKLKVEAERVQFLAGGRRDEAGAPAHDDADLAPPARESRRPTQAPEPRGTGNGPARSGYNNASTPPPTTRRPAAAPSPPEEEEDIPF
jgi:single-strand DNA-binding protein